jgi:hypothetical protein
LSLAACFDGGGKMKMEMETRRAVKQKAGSAAQEVARRKRKKNAIHATVYSMWHVHVACCNANAATIAIRLPSAI